MTTQQLAFGVDIGGSTVKGAVVDLQTGELASDRYSLTTPEPSTPEAVAATVAKLVREAGWDGPVGITVPGVVIGGTVRFVGNIHDDWVGTNARALLAEALDGREITVLNDADAAGLAEFKFGEVSNYSGVVLLLTFGTGVGSALLYNGILIPNTELGQVEVDGHIAEDRSAAVIKERENLTYPQWAAEVSKLLQRLEKWFSPTVFIVGGGISEDWKEWIPLLDNKTEVVPATLRNRAGIVGAALAVATGVAP